MEGQPLKTYPRSGRRRTRRRGRKSNLRAKDSAVQAGNDGGNLASSVAREDGARRPDQSLTTVRGEDEAKHNGAAMRPTDELSLSAMPIGAAFPSLRMTRAISSRAAMHAAHGAQVHEAGRHKNPAQGRMRSAKASWPIATRLVLYEALFLPISSRFRNSINGSLVERLTFDTFRNSRSNDEVGTVSVHAMQHVMRK